jgi:hypothetical protein
VWRAFWVLGCWRLGGLGDPGGLAMKGGVCCCGVVGVVVAKENDASGKPHTRGTNVLLGVH